MGHQFAGAADLGQRRRRRLASNDAETTECDTTALAVPGVSSMSLHEAQLLRRAISPRLWKHVLILISVPLVLAVLFWLSSRGREGVQNVSAHSLTNGLSGLFLLLAAQLAAVTGWLRSRSEVDFQGRYRWWKWMAAGMCGFSALLLTDTFSDLPMFVAAVLEPLTGPLQSARNAVVLIPVMTYCLVVLSRILPDMNRSFWSQGLLIIAVLTSVVRFMLSHSSAVASISDATQSLLILSTTYAAFASMLLHCRFVAFICNDPPKIGSRLSAEAH